MPRTRARRVPFAALLLGVLAGSMCVLLALNTATAASEVRERRLDAANATLNANQEQLSRTISGLQAPAQLARMAAALGMVPAGSPAYFRINANGTITVLGHPAAIVAPPKVVKLTAAQKAAAQLAKANLAKANLAKAKLAKANLAKAKLAKAKPTSAKARTSTGTRSAGTTTPNAKSTSPTTTSPNKTGPTKTSPTKTSPTKTSPTKAPVPTLTIPGGPR